MRNGYEFKCLVVLFWAFALSACGVLNAPDTPATLRAENTAYSVEATSIPQTYAADQVMIEGTAAAQGTTVAQMGSINRQLIMTARAVIPPTLARTVGTVVPGANSTLSANGLQFTGMGVATSVRESDGCAVSFETQIPENAPTIYVNTKALSVRGGTVMRAEWSANGQMIVQDTWTVPRDETNFCIWFNLDPARIPFTTGPWSVQLFADGVQIGSAIQFNIVGAASGSG